MKILALTLVCLISSIFATPDELVGQFLEDTTDAQCNDGSAPLYWKRTNPDSSQWLIFLEGGGLCWDTLSCIERYLLIPKYTTSKSPTVPSNLTQPGIFNPDCYSNPVFCNYNVFLLHYCSSDMWSGNKTYKPGFLEPDIFRFQGYNILNAVLRQIVEKYPEIKQAHRIIFGGGSAGAMGAQYQGDRVHALLKELIVSEFDFKIFSDSGWFHPGPGYIPNLCTVICNFELMVTSATKYMDIRYDQSCEEQYPGQERWKCAFPIEQHVLEDVSTPTFYVTYLYDLAQLTNDGIFKILLSNYSPEEKQWAIGRKNETTERIAKIDNIAPHAFYGINCRAHVISITDSQVNQLRINDNLTFSEAFQLWLDGEEIKLVDDKCGDEIACNPKCPLLEQGSMLSG